MPEPQFISEKSITTAPSDIHAHIFRNVAKIEGLEEADTLAKPLPKILQNIPIYDIKEIIDLASKNGNHPEFSGGGLSGDVYKINLSANLKCAVKIMHTSGVSKNKQLSTNIDIREVAPNELNYVYKQTAGLVLGHSIEPNYVDPPYCLVSYKGQVVGFAMSLYNGPDEHFDKAVELTGDTNLYSATKRLNNGGANLDDIISGGANSLIVNNHGKKEIKIVDITANDEVLEIDPRNPQPEGFYVHKVSQYDPLFDQEGRFSTTSFTHQEIEMKILEYQSSLDLVTNRDLTFNDVCEGKAMITTNKIIAKNKEAIVKIRKKFDSLRELGVDVDNLGEYEISEESMSMSFEKDNGDKAVVSLGISGTDEFEPEKYFRMYYKSKKPDSYIIFEKNPNNNTVEVCFKDSNGTESDFTLDTHTNTMNGYVDLHATQADKEKKPLTSDEVLKIKNRILDTFPGFSFDDAKKNFRFIIDKIKQ